MRQNWGTMMNIDKMRGPINVSELFNVHPFNNKHRTMRITRRKIRSHTRNTVRKSRKDMNTN
jgi:hypothetical protein